MAEQDTTAPQGGMRFYFGQPVGFMLNGQMPLVRAVVIRPEPDRDGQIAIAYIENEDDPCPTYQWSDAIYPRHVKPWPLRSHEDHGWLNPEQARELRDTIITLAHTNDSLQGTVDSLCEQLEDLRDQNRRQAVTIQQLMHQTPSIVVPSWAHSVAGSIIRVAQLIWQQTSSPNLRRDLDTLIELAKIIRGEQPSPLPAPPHWTDAHPDKPI